MKADKTTITRLVRIEWQTIGRIIKRVGEEHLAQADGSGSCLRSRSTRSRGARATATSRSSPTTRAGAWCGAPRARARPPPISSSTSSTAGRGPPAHAGRPSWEPEPAIMVPFGPCPIVPAGEGIRRMAPGRQRDRAGDLRTRVPADRGLDGHDRRVRQERPRARAQATIVIDNYHVVQLATKALDEVRREYWNELRHAGQAGAAKAVQARSLGAAQEPFRSHRPPSGHTRRDPGRRREGRACLDDERDGQSDLRPRPHRRGRSELLDRLLCRLSRCRLAPFIRLGCTIRKHRQGILPPVA